MLTEKDVAVCVKEWAKFLRLEHWEFELDLSGSDIGNESEGQILIPQDYNYGSISLKANWEHWPQRLLDEVVCHEILHAHFHQIEMSALEGKVAFNKEAGRLYWRRIEHEIEQSVEALSLVLLNTKEENEKLATKAQRKTRSKSNTKNTPSY